MCGVEKMLGQHRQQLDTQRRIEGYDQQRGSELYAVAYQRGAVCIGYYHLGGVAATTTKHIHHWA